MIICSYIKAHLIHLKEHGENEYFKKKLYFTNCILLNCILLNIEFIIFYHSQKKTSMLLHIFDDLFLKLFFHVNY
jgi:hypothetical protein